MPGATDDELVGLLRTWAAIESWAAGAKLAVIAEMIRRDDAPRHGGHHGDLPDEWSASLRHELAAALACSVQSAETTAWLAWEQQARLPGVRALLSDGTLTLPKARAVTETFRYLSDADAARAEALILGQLAGKTYTQVLRLAEQAALTVDPGLAERRREQAQKKDARVTFFRELSGTAACPAATCRRTRPSPRWPASTPAPRSTRTRERSAAPAWTSCAPTPTSTSSRAPRPRPGSPAPRPRMRPRSRRGPRLGQGAGGQDRSRSQRRKRGRGRKQDRS